MASNGSSRTPFDDDLVTDPGAPKDTQQLPTPASGGAQPIRPSRLLPPQAGSAPAPYAGVTPVTPPVPVSAPPAGPGPTPPNDTSTLSLKRTPTSTIVGLSMAGGAVAVLLISALVRGVVHRTLGVATPTPTAPVVAQPTPLNSELVPTPGTVESPGVPVTTQNAADIAPATATPPVDPAAATIAPTPRHRRRQAAPTASDAPTAGHEVTRDAASATQEQDPAPSGSSETRPSVDQSAKTRPQDAAQPQDDSATVDTASTQPAAHRRADYSITPPPGFRLVKRGQRTVWEGPDGVTLLVETTSRPGRSPFGDWLRLDAMLRRKYGRHYRSHGIDQTTVAGQPGAIWDFELDTKAGTVRKVDVGVHSNGRGYAILGSVPILKFDAARPAIESAIRSFDLTPADAPPPTYHRRAHRSHHHSDATADQAGDNTNANGSDNASPQSDDLRPDAGY